MQVKTEWQQDWHEDEGRQTDKEYEKNTGLNRQTLINKWNTGEQAEEQNKNMSHEDRTYKTKQETVTNPKSQTMTKTAKSKNMLHLTVGTGLGK